jgi:N-acetylglucosamine kinase-like BadF-type ATPase
MGLCIGIEAIGMRYTAGVIATEDGAIIGGKRIFGDPISLHTTPRDLLRSRLNQLFKSLIDEVGVSPDELNDCKVCIGMTGVNSKFDAEVDLPRECGALALKFGKLICTGDAEIVLASHCQSLDGSGIICGLGSSSFVAGSGIFHRVGGWGPALEDEGSGYSMGRAAARAIGEEADLHEEPSILWGEISQWLNDQRSQRGSLSEWIVAALKWQEYVNEHRESLERTGPPGSWDIRTALCGFAHQMLLDLAWRSVAGGFVLPLMKAWDSGDARSSLIIDRAAHDLANQHFAASCVFPNHPLEPFILYGGVPTHNPRFRELLMTVVSKFQGRHLNAVGPWSPGAMRPAAGALLYALAPDCTSGSLRLPSRSIILNVRASYGEYSAEFNLEND